jgi:hypothetical protein
MENRVVVSLVGEDSSFIAMVERSQRQFGNFAGAAERFGSQGQKLKSVLFQLGTQAVGLGGPVGRLAEVLSSFAVGGGIAGAAAAGIGLIAVQLRKAKEEAVQARQPLMDLVDEYRKASGMARAEQLFSARQSMGRLEDVQKTLGRGFLPKLDLAEREAAGLGFFDSPESARAKIERWVDGSLRIAREAFARAAREQNEQASAFAAAAFTPKPMAKGTSGGVAPGVRAAFEVEGASAAWLQEQAAKSSETFFDAIDKSFTDWQQSRRAAGDQASDFYASLIPSTLPDLSGVAAQVPVFLERAKQQAEDWRMAWLQAGFAVESGLTGVFMALFDRGQTFVDRIQEALANLLRSIQAVFAQLLARQIIGAIGSVAGGLSSGGGGSGFGVDAIPGGGGLALRQAQPVTVTNVFNVSALDARGVQDVILENYGAVTAATMRGLSESRMASMSLGIR